MYKIYCIIDNTNNNVYIGKTKTKYLSKRINNHESDFRRGKYCSSQKILKNNNWIYKLLEDDLNEYEAKQREAYYIQNTENCINDLKYHYEYKNHKRNYEKYKTHYKNYNKNYAKLRWANQKSWGGNDNCLLWINTDLFKN